MTLSFAWTCLRWVLTKTIVQGKDQMARNASGFGLDFPHQIESLVLPAGCFTWNHATLVGLPTTPLARNWQLVSNLLKTFEDYEIAMPFPLKEKHDALALLYTSTCRA